MNQTTPLADLEKMLTFYCDDLTDVLGAAEKTRRGAKVRPVVDHPGTWRRRTDDASSFATARSSHDAVLRRRR